MTRVAHPPPRPGTHLARTAPRPAPDPRFEKPAPTATPSPAMGVGEAARYTGLSRETIRRRFRDGLIPGNFVGHRLVLNRASVEHLVPPAGAPPSALDRAIDAVGELVDGDAVEAVLLACVERLRQGGLR